MSKARKILLWGGCVAGVFCVLAVAAALLLTHLFNTGVIGRNLQTEIEARYHIRASQIRIVFRPLPLVAVREVNVVIPGTLDASVETVFIHLKFWPLFTGKLAPAKIELLSPVIAVRLPSEGTPLQGLQNVIQTIFGRRAGLSGREAVLAGYGALKIFCPNDRCFSFKQITFKSTVAHGGLDFQLRIGRSSFWQTLELKGQVDPDTLKGSGELNITGANPANLARFLDAPASRHIGGSVADITAALFYNGGKSFRADFAATVPSFLLGTGPNTITVKDGFLAGVLLADAKGIDLSFSNLRFDQPHLSLTASCVERYSDGSFTLTIDTTDTDAATVRSVLLAVNKKTRGIHRFFNILRKAQMLNLHFSAHANDFSGLRKLKNSTTKCTIEKGVVLAPKADLLVSNVSGDIQIKGGILTATHVSGQTPGSSTQGGELTVGLPHQDSFFHMVFPVEADLSELPPILTHLAQNNTLKHKLAQFSEVTGKTTGTLVIDKSLGGPITVKVNTGPFNLSCRYADLPGPISLKGASFSMDDHTIAFSDVDTALADSTLSVSGSLNGFLGPHAAADLQLSGRLGPEGTKIATSLFGLPKWLKPISRMDLLASTLTWEKGTQTTFDGKIQLSGGPLIEADVLKTPGELSIRRLAIRDKYSDALIAMSSLQDGYRIGFSGSLSDKTIDGLLTADWPFKGPIRGKFQADLYPGSPEKSSAAGEITLSDFRLPGILPPSATIEKATIEARGKKLGIKSAVATWAGSRLNLTGSVALTGAAYRLDMNASAQSLDLDRILKSKWITRKIGKKPGPLQPGSRKKPWDMPLTGILRVKSKRLSYGKVKWTHAEGDVSINKGSVHIRLIRANVCGISTPAQIEVTPEGALISIDPSARGKHLQSTLTCLFNERPLISGSYELTGHIQAKIPRNDGKQPLGPAGVMRSLEGKVELTAEHGLILRFDILTKIISVLSISEIYRGVVPDLLEKGCPYRVLHVNGTIKNGRLRLHDSVLDGPSIKMVFSGQINLVTRKLHLIALVAPQRTVERVVNATPILGTVLKDAFVTVPVGISGNLDDPSVIILSPAAVGHELLGVMERLVKLPLTIFHPLIRNSSTLQ